MADALVSQLARALNLSPDAARHTLNHLVATLREQIEASGAASVPGLGTFSREDDLLVFVPEDALARAVNHRYAGLRPIAAGPVAAAPPPAAPSEPEDPFAAESPSAPARLGQREEPAAEPAPPADFQPLETLIEPDRPAPDEEVEREEADVEEADTGEVTADHELPASDLVPGEREIELAPDEPRAEPEAPLEEEEEPVSKNEDLAPEEQAEINALLADARTSASAIPGEPAEEDHDLEEAEVEAGLGEETDEAAFDEDEVEEDVEDEDIFEETVLEEEERELEDEDEVKRLFAAEVEDDEVDEDEEMPSDASVLLPAEPPPVAESTPEPSPEPRPPVAPAVAPAVAATSAPAPGREVARPARRSNTPLVAGAAVLLLAIVALLWFLNREPAGPTVAQRQPVPADTAAATPPPVDTVAALAPVDSAVVAATPEPAPPEPPSTDPLRSTAGIDPAGGGWTWVVASEFDRATAERRVARYRDQGLRADVIAGDAGGRTRYRVGLGQFATTDEANRFRSDLPADVPEGTWLLQL